MVNGRNKGASFEREVAKMLFDELGVKFKRDIEQYRAADHGDLICDDPTFPFTLELKRYAKGYMHKRDWWEQVRKAADAQGKEPVLIYKYDRLPIMCVMRLAYVLQDERYNDEHLITIDWDAFIYIARESWE